MPTIVELVSNIIAAIDDIYKPDEATGLAKRNVPVSKLAEIRTQAQRALDAVTKQPTNADLLSAIKSMQGKVETRTEEVLKGISKTNSTWADVAANARLAPAGTSAQPARASMRTSEAEKTAEATKRSKEITIKVNDANIVKQLRDRTPLEIAAKVNAALAASTHPQLQTIKVLATRQLRSGDLCVSLPSEVCAQGLRDLQNEWIGGLAPRAVVSRRTYGVLMHGVAVKGFDVSDPATRASLIRQNCQVHDLEILRLTWLTNSMLRRHPGILCLRALSGEEQRYQVTENVLFNVVGLILR
jgi:hypothetical protein